MADKELRLKSTGRKDKQPLRSQNVLLQRFQNSRAELFALKQPVSDKKALQNTKTILKKKKKTRKKLLLRGQHPEYSGDSGIIVLAWTHCFGQTKITDRNKVIVICDSLTSVPFSHKPKKEIICPVLMKIKRKKKKKKKIHCL